MNTDLFGVIISYLDLTEIDVPCLKNIAYNYAQPKIMVSTADEANIYLSMYKNAQFSLRWGCNEIFPNIVEVCDILITNYNISALPKLKKLNLIVSKIFPQNLQYVPSLTEIVVGDCIINKDLQHLKHLTHLDLSNNYTITDEVFLYLPNIQSICLRKNTKITGKYFHKLPNLVSLNLTSYTAVQNNYLSKLTNIKKLILNGNFQVNDLILINLTNLEYLDLQFNKVITLHAIEQLPNLQKIRISQSNSKISILETNFPHINIIKTIL